MKREKIEIKPNRNTKVKSKLKISIRETLRSRKGATCVFISLILSSMVFAATVIADASYEKLKESEVDAALRIGARSVLGEYDIRLKNDYGIFAYTATCDEVAEKLKNYGFHSLSGSCEKMNANSIEVNADNMDYSLLDCNILKEELVRAGKLCAFQSRATLRTSAATPSEVVRNETAIKTLASGGKNLHILNLDGFDFVNLGRYKTGENYFLNEYINGSFKSRFMDIPNRSSIFNYEKEYILSGKFSEEQSLSYVKRSIFTLREGLNTAHILADHQKMEEVMELAAAISAVGEPLEAAVIVAIWASAESSNDVKLLLEGNKVAFNKTKSQWALTLPKAIVYAFTDGSIKPQDKSGKLYDEYLEAMLYLQDDETKILRIADLIQLNLRADYNNSLLIKEFYTGFNFTAFVDGKEYSYEQYY